MSEILEKFDSSKDVYDSYAMSLKSLLNNLIREAGHTIHSLDSRVKNRVSLGEKILRKGKYECIEDITDIVGVRIISHYSDDVDEIAKIIESEFLVDKENSIDKRASMEPDRFGYLSLHYVVNLSETRTQLKEYAPFKSIKAEIQIRSILQHTWAEIEHDIGYKSANGLPNDIKRYFSRLAGLLEIADDEFIKIRQSISARQKEVASMLENGAGENTLDLVSLNEYLNKSKTIEALVNNFYTQYGLKIGNATKNLENIFDGLTLLNINTINTLDNKMIENKAAILNRVKAFSSDYIPNFKGADLPRDLLVAFLMQILVAKENSPELENKFHEAVRLALRKKDIPDFFERIRNIISEG